MSSKVTILDGGMGRELLRNGAPFRQPEWSALSLIEAPEFVKMAHDAFVAAGAEVITTNSYALVPFHIGDQRFATHGFALADLSGRLARAAAQKAQRYVRVAGSLPPVFGSYRPDLFDADKAPAILDILVKALAPHVDFWLAETQSSVQEVETIRTILGSDTRPLWVSFTLDDTKSVADVIAGRSVPTLRSGEAVAHAAVKAARLGAGALLFNCSQAEIMEAGVKSANQALKADNLDIPIGVYANAFVPKPETEESLAANDGLSGLRDDLNPSGYLQFAQRWVSAGATIIGGCCGIGPEHIAELKDTFDPQPAAA
ncbi:homocysteine S-methyltransferase family protein (plasmid) [Agrobacterium radiobacter]|uniref:Homocysteine S-methyltransferase n=2 Tax=Agrobacterium tumefaciens TaxID=358 RepID=A0A2Z2PEZ4_AGRTU|nr:MULTISPECIES: homocysteine S-methyltransferase family protein [Rhizobium/Agrobacterium group]AKC10917.1 homocysteine methyltransferase [Agrobacterium tumefaciens]ASK41537.1 homocysteine S-methyltransferase [Agrobacterium tumefaciens]ASK47166.1 homocysteine S-methyltransferase family protein [Agrobacterium radiobacter]AYM20389.1 homocysteine methyltransferase [Agrobacterium tumefaciens]AYM71690.1 homocysteine methyltransferase [Agrobacterium tumefaciens]